jgi:cation diffusion facilitator CzcD-associated flavoprotein CzcO
MKSVAIVGAGFSGSLLAMHLMREGVDLQVTLIEKRGRFGPGLGVCPRNSQ